jgi:hypothetical protein
MSDEQRILTRARELAETGELAAEVIIIIGRARAARVDQDALGGLVRAVRALDGDPVAMLHAAAGTGHPFATDIRLVAAAEEAAAEIADRKGTAEQLRRRAVEALHHAGEDLAEAEADLARARAMPIWDPCEGCHPARAAAIAAAQEEIRECRQRISRATEAIQTLGHLLPRLRRALAALAEVPEDLYQVYEVVYELIRQDPGAMPSDGDFITGQGATRLAALLRSPESPDRAGADLNDIARRGKRERQAGGAETAGHRPAVPATVR